MGRRGGRTVSVGGGANEPYQFHLIIEPPESGGALVWCNLPRPKRRERRVKKKRRMDG